MADIQRRTFVSQNDGSLHHVLKLSDITWPVVIDERIKCALAKTGNVFFMALTKALKKPVD